MDLEVYTKIFVYIILIIMDFLNRYPYDSHPGAVSGNFRCGEFFPKAVGRGRGVGQSPTERRRRKF